MNEAKLHKHIKRLCKKNLKSTRVSCCAECPFEEEIVAHDPSTKALFKAKQRQVRLSRR